MWSFAPCIEKRHTSVPDASWIVTVICFASLCFSLPWHSHNAPAAAFLTSLFSDDSSFSSSTIADWLFVISFLFSSSNARVHNVSLAFKLSSSSSAFCSIVTRTGRTPHFAIWDDRKKAVRSAYPCMYLSCSCDQLATPISFWALARRVFRILSTVWWSTLSVQLHLFFKPDKHTLSDKAICTMLWSSIWVHRREMQVN